MTAQASTPHRPRVLHCVSHLALGGAERVATTLIEASQSNYEYRVYAVRGVADGDVGRALQQQLTDLGVTVCLGPRIPMRFGGMVTGGLGLAKAVREFSPDIIHLHTEIPEASYAAMVTFQPSLRSIPVVRTIHNTRIWHFWPVLGRWCDRRMPNASVAGVSDGAVEAFLQLRLESGAPPPRVKPRTIFNGVKPFEAPRADRDPRQPLRIVFGGRFEHQKGTDLLPEIIRQVHLPKNQRAHLTLFGSGAHEMHLRTMAAAPPEGWSVEIRPPTADFPLHLGEFDLMIVPSRYEGLGLVAVEALLASVPVVATRIPGLQEALPPDYPWRARPDDASSFAAALSAACKARAEWAAVVAAANEFARRRFAPALMAEAYRDLYETALSNRGGSR
jgi:glycosyltransferase involved in cell wall biosynthesis